jgi:acyl carrier protein
MSMSIDEFKTTIEREFEVDIPEATAQQMSTVGEAYIYLLREAQRKSPLSCSTSQAFYRLRRVLTSDFKVNRKRVRPSATLWNLFPRKRRESAFAELGTILDLPDLSSLVPPARPPTLRGLRKALLVGSVAAWLLNVLLLLVDGKPESVAMLFLIWFLILIAVLEWFGIIWFVRFLGMKPILKVRHLVVRLAAQDSEQNLDGNQTRLAPATWTKLTTLLSAQTGVPADKIRPENRWEDLAVPAQLPAPAEPAPVLAVESEGRKGSRLWTTLIFLGRTIFILLRVVFYPITFLSWAVPEISGEGPRSRQLKMMFHDRPPLPGPAFLELCGCKMGDAAIWLSIRQAVAHCCKLPETAIYPYDDVSSMEWMMADPGPDAPWYVLGCNWMDVVFHVQETLGVRIYTEELDERWRKEKAKGKMETLNELAALLTEVIDERSGRVLH